MKPLLYSLILTGILTVIGLCRPLFQTEEISMRALLPMTAWVVAASLWVLAPMLTTWRFLSRNRLPLTRTLLFLCVTGLLLVWGLGAILALFGPPSHGSLGLLFWPILEWFALFAIYVVWVYEGAKKRKREAQQVTPTDNLDPLP